MTRLRMLVIVATMGALLLGLAACDEEDRRVFSQLIGCGTDAECEEGQHCCENRCHECCADYDCDEDKGERCSDEHKCVKAGEPPTEPQPESEEPPSAPESESEFEQPPPAEFEPLECLVDEDCCDLHEGQVWECDDDNHCVKVGCDTPQDCKDICPTGNWDCDTDFGDCFLKATPTPEPQCTDDADCDPDADEECVDGECVKPAPGLEPDEPAPPPVLTETTLIGFVPKDIDMGVVVHRFDHKIYVFSGWFNGTGCGKNFSEAVPKVCEDYEEVADGQVGADGAFSLSAPLGPTFVWYATGVDQDGQVVIAFAMDQVDTTGTTKQETPVEIEWRFCGVDF